MGRVLFWVAFAALIYLGLVMARRRRCSEKTAKTAPQSEKKSPARMVKCPVCGVFFPESDAVLGDGLKFCSEKCRKRARGTAE